MHQKIRNVYWDLVQMRCEVCRACFQERGKARNFTLVRTAKYLPTQHYMVIPAINIAPKPFTRYVIVSAQNGMSSQTQEDWIAAPELTQNPARHSYPDTVLTHRFMPFGSATVEATSRVNVGDERGMDIDVATVAAAAAASQIMDISEDKESREKKEKKGKKRRVEKEGKILKKTKKMKMSAAA
jgi:hypothetical protein